MNNVVQFKTNSSKLFRVKRNTWNYYKTLFIISFTFNIIFFIKFLLE